ncbi:MAG TPA: hypothetical protein VF238_11075 [Methylomirabilota bacterium]
MKTRKQPGLSDAPGRNDLRPNMRDEQPERGVFSFVKPVMHVQDMGAPRDSLTPWRGVPTPASAQFTAKNWMEKNPSPKPNPRTHPIQVGLTEIRRNKKEVPEA